MLALMIEPRYTVDIDGLLDLQKAEWLVYNAGLDMVHPGHRRRSLPKDVSLIVFDFDGVMTDNRVWVDQDGREMVAANRSDSLGTDLLRERHPDRAVCFIQRDQPGGGSTLPQDENSGASGCR